MKIEIKKSKGKLSNTCRTCQKQLNLKSAPSNQNCLDVEEYMYTQVMYTV
jgi:hypothetical protein